MVTVSTIKDSPLTIFLVVVSAFLIVQQNSMKLQSIHVILYSKIELLQPSASHAENKK